MLGCPGSGKSYFAGLLGEKMHMARFNSDHMRQHLYSNPLEHHTRQDHLQIVGAINYAAQAVLRVGHSAIYDLNNNFASDRQKTAILAREFGATTIIVWVKTPLAVAIERGATRPTSREHIRVPPDWIERVAAEIEPPRADELCIEIDGMLQFEAQYKQFQEQMRVFMR